MTSAAASGEPLDRADAPATRTGAPARRNDRAGDRRQGDAPRQVIAVDGPGGSGKSTVAGGIARALGWQHLDTGSMYRAVTLAVLDAGVEPTDAQGVATVVDGLELRPSLHEGSGSVRLGDRIVDRELRTDAVTAAVSAVSAQPRVREAMVAQQQAIARGSRGIVIEGRDIGTVVTPDAPVKIYLTASDEARAARRAKQIGDPAAAAQVQADLARRDTADAGRALSPLAQAADALVLDTTDMTAQQAIDEALQAWRNAGGAAEAYDRRQPERPRTLERHEPVSPEFFDEVHATRTRYWKRWVTTLKPVFRGTFHLLWKVRVSGLENIPKTGPVLIVGNHAGFLDGPLVVSHVARNVHILAKIELYKGALKHFMLISGQIPVDRGRPDRVALRECLAVLRRGAVLGIFPEGSRGASGEMRDVRGGAAYLYLHAPCAVVPVVATGTDIALPKGGKPKFRVPIALDFGAPIPIEVTGDPRARSTLAAVTGQIQAGMAAHFDDVRRSRG